MLSPFIVIIALPTTSTHVNPLYIILVDQNFDTS